jgi:predicted RNA-binding Zn ribbon-like protein
MDDVWEPIEHYDPVGGNLALDLANTANRAVRPVPQEKLRTYEDVVVWGERTGMLDAARARALRAEAGARPEAAAEVLARTVELREAIYRIFSAVGSGAEPVPADVAVLDAYLREGAGQRRLDRGRGGWTWKWEAGAEPLAQLLWPAAYAAADLLTEGELARVKECANDECTWLFVDMSKNRSRRWCDMKDCGNRVKARRHYRRTKRRRDAP